MLFFRQKVSLTRCTIGDYRISTISDENVATIRDQRQCAGFLENQLVAILLKQAPIVDEVVAIPSHPYYIANIAAKELV